MPRRWLSIRVHLVHGRGEDFDPAPGRVMVLPPGTTFEQFGAAVDLALGRWDLAHLRRFVLPDGTEVVDAEMASDLVADAFSVDAVTPRTRALTSRVSSAVTAGEVFEYVFDFGDDWTHVCRVEAPVDPIEVLGTLPDRPMACWGWGSLPDQYGRRWVDDDGSPESEPEPNAVPTVGLSQRSALERRADATPVDIVAVRKARHAGSATQLVDALVGVDLSSALQQVGSALLVVHAGSKPVERRALADHMVGVVNRLELRRWEGDDVLIDDLLAAVRGESQRGGGAPVDLDEFVSLANGPDGQRGAYVNRITAQVVPHFLVEEFSEGDEEWVDVYADDWVEVDGVGGHAAYEDMAAFARTQPSAVQARLEMALDGKGAFSRFRREVDELDLVGPWRLWSDDRAWGRARAELAHHGLSGR